MGERIDELTKAMAAGDNGAVERFYRRYFDWLYAQARRTTRRDEAFCLDVVQDAVLRIIRNVRAVESETQWLTWMMLVVQTAALDRLRTEQRSRAREAVVAVRDGASGEEEKPGQIEQTRWLAEQIALLDPRLVEIIHLRYQRGWTLTKVGQALGVSAGTIDGRLRRAFKTLWKRARECGHV